jgi:hypothetical protein
MNISISTVLFSSVSPVQFNYRADSDIEGVSRRVTRYPTLDGGVSFFDGGFTDGDRSLAIRTNDAEAAEAIRELGKYHQQFVVGWWGNCLLCRFQSVLVNSDGSYTISMLGAG